MTLFIAGHGQRDTWAGFARSHETVMALSCDVRRCTLERRQTSNCQLGKDEDQE
jgi:hypothetical protein